MKRHEFTAKIKEAAAMRAEGHCEMCGRELLYAEHEYDHCIPLALGGGNGIDNIVVTCKSCHSQKTCTVDVPTIAKAKRNFRRASNIPKARGRAIPGSKRSPWRKKISGETVKR